MHNVFFTSISALAEGYRSNQLSPVEVTQQFLARIDSVDGTLNSFITVMSDQALQQARELETELLNGHIRSPLHGVPIAVKDMIQTKGTLTTAGSKVLANWVPDEDATVISKLKHAGAIIIGKTNMHEFAMGATSENPHYGTVKNPWDLTKISGGSSGGSAVSVATGLCYGAVGSDTAGSIRLPAALCGIVGFKPTYGRVSRYGSIPFSWSLDHLGPMARTVKDAAILFEAMVGYDPKDPCTRQHKTKFYISPKSGYLQGKRFGYCREYFFEQVNSEIEQLIQRSMERLKALGAEIVEIDLSGIVEAQQALKWIAQSEANSFHKPVYSQLPDWYSEDIGFRLKFGSDVSAEEYLNGQKIRKKFIHQVLQKMEGIDALISPMNHNPPFEIGSITPDQAINNMFRLAKAPLGNFLGFPAISVPAGFTSEHLPVGIQFMAKPFEDIKLLQLAEAFEQSEPWSGFLEKNNIYELN